MIDRYRTDAIRELFSPAHRLLVWIDVEVANAKGFHFTGTVEALNRVRNGVRSSIQRGLALQDIRMRESKTKHDVAAFVNWLEEKSGMGNVHFQMTSSDLVDSANAVIIHNALSVIGGAVDDLGSALARLIGKHEGQRVMARTHGRYAVPMTLEHKIRGHLEQLHDCRKVLNSVTIPGKMSGPVGEGLGGRVEELAMDYLGVRAAHYPTQVVSRAYYADLHYALARVMATVERLALEVRLSSRDETAELLEGFTEGQVGSSAMPHKRNPIGCENICSLSRLVRSMVAPAMENMLLWQERDLSHSAVERVNIEGAFHLTHFALQRMTDIMDKIQVNAELMARRAEDPKARTAEMLNRMVEGGFGREEAHAALARVSAQAEQWGTDFMALAMTDPVVGRYA